MPSISFGLPFDQKLFFESDQNDKLIRIVYITLDTITLRI